MSGDSWYDSLLSEDGKDHPLIGMSYRTQEDQFDHVTFYKLIRDSNETYQIFTFGRDVIQTNFLRPTTEDIHSNSMQGASLVNGSFMWTRQLSSGNFRVNQLLICGSN